MLVILTVNHEMNIYYSILNFFCPVAQEDVGVIRQVDPTTKEVSYNPRYEEMFSPQVKQFMRSFAFTILMLF